MWLQLGVLSPGAESCFQLDKILCFSFLPKRIPGLLYLFVYFSLHEWEKKIMFSKSNVAEWNNRLFISWGNIWGWLNCSQSTSHVFTPFFYLTNWLWQVSPKLCCSVWPDVKAEAEQVTSVDEIERICMDIFLIDFSSIWCQLITESHSLHKCKQSLWPYFQLILSPANMISDLFILSQAEIEISMVVKYI